ncbi:MAG: stage V sporulation protein D (sporulation-specific penicillin-binding protein), partial [Planctomycetota bacterium]
NSIHELGLQNRIKLRMPGSPKHEVPMHNNPRQIDAGVSVPFGHQITLSPLAMTAAFNILATGGMYHAPRLVSSVIRGSEVVPNPIKSKRVLREDVADHTLDVLERTVNEGTCKVLKSLPWHVGAKTGTAQRWPKNIRAFNSSVIAIAPVANPRITVYVGLYDVRGAVVTAGQTAGPAVKEIIQKCLEHMSVVPDREQKKEHR